jgi:hypothetical protein
MDTILSALAGLPPIAQAACAGTVTRAITALGAAVVFLGRELPERFLDAMLGFAAGVMDEDLRVTPRFLQLCGDFAIREPLDPAPGEWNGELRSDHFGERRIRRPARTLKSSIPSSIRGQRGAWVSVCFLRPALSWVVAHRGP